MKVLRSLRFLSDQHSVLNIVFQIGQVRLVKFQLKLTNVELLEVF